MVDYDADGLGAGVRGDAKKINQIRRFTSIEFNPFVGSSSKVVNPKRDPFQSDNDTSTSRSGRTNEDFFANIKAQAWWSLRKRFRATYRAVVEKMEYNAEEVISISTSVASYQKLLTELSQPTYSQNTVGKIVVNKKPDSARSPNLADAVMIAFAPQRVKARGFFDV